MTAYLNLFSYDENSVLTLLTVNKGVLNVNRNAKQKFKIVQTHPLISVDKAYRPRTVQSRINSKYLLVNVAFSLFRGYIVNVQGH